MKRLLCWLGRHRWFYGTDNAGDSIVAGVRYCSRCYRLDVWFDKPAAARTEEGTP